jgi:two-component system, LytTR family, sensor kinase
LKSQINPHQLFNIINSIYSTSVINPDSTPELISKLAILLRYNIGYLESNFIPINSEVEYLNAYLDFQKLRLTEKTTLDFNLEIYHENTVILPFVFITFIENAYKFGASPYLASNIKLELKVTSENIFFNICNKIVNEKVISTGIGLKNVKRRLDLAYGSLYTLKTISNHEEYQVKLTISNR